jgi:hypothetical protein
MPVENERKIALCTIKYTVALSCRLSPCHNLHRHLFSQALHSVVELLVVLFCHTWRLYLKLRHDVILLYHSNSLINIIT